MYYSTAEVGQLMGKSTKTAWKWLRREGALIKRHGRCYTTAERLMACFPEVFQELAR